MVFLEYQRGSAYGVGQPKALYVLEEGVAGESFKCVIGIDIMLDFVSLNELWEMRQLKLHGNNLMGLFKSMGSLDPSNKLTILPRHPWNGSTNITSAGPSRPQDHFLLLCFDTPCKYRYW